MTASTRIRTARFIALALFAAFAVSSSAIADDSAVPEDILSATLRTIADGKADAEKEAREPATAERPAPIPDRIGPAESTLLK
jgi:hypothetical protein